MPTYDGLRMGKVKEREGEVEWGGKSSLDISKGIPRKPPSRHLELRTTSRAEYMMGKASYAVRRLKMSYCPFNCM